MQPFIFIAIMVVAVVFLIILPQRRRQKQQQDLLGGLEPGVRVLLAGGIFGTVTAIGEKTLSVEIAPGVVIEIVREAVLRRTPDEAAIDATRSEAPTSEDSATDDPKTDEPTPAEAPDTTKPDQG